MQETVNTIYIGELRTEATHVQSGNKLITDAPLDNKGKGKAFSPTDLLATSLGSCMLTIIGIAAMEHGFNIDDAKVNIWKIMKSDPRRVGERLLNLHFRKRTILKKKKNSLKKQLILVR